MKISISKLNFNRINKIKIHINIKFQQDSFKKLTLILIKNSLFLNIKLALLIRDSKVQLKKITTANLEKLFPNILNQILKVNKNPVTPLTMKTTLVSHPL